MKYRRTLAAAIAFTIGAIVPAPSAVEAVNYHFDGVVVDAKGGAPLEGIELIATEPGVIGVAWTTSTDAAGIWSIDVAAEEYEIYFDGGTDYQSGYGGCSGAYVTPTPGCSWGPRSGVETRMFATFASGRILDSATSGPVAGALVTATREDGVTVLGTDVTEADGSYRVDGLVGDEIGLHVDGSSVGYGSGWFACASGVVVPTFGEACTHAPGHHAERYVDAIVADPPRFVAFSFLRRSITLFVLDPGTDGEILGYELTCQSRRTGDVTTATYDARFQTQFGFDRGINRCTLEVVGPAGPGPEAGPRSIWVR